MSLVSTAFTIVTGLVGVVMVVEGLLKLSGRLIEDFERFGYPRWFGYAVGAVELLGGATIAAGLVLGEGVVLVGGLVVGGVLAGAVASHLRVGDSAGETAPAAGLLALAVGIVLVTLPVV